MERIDNLVSISIIDQNLHVCTGWHIYTHVYNWLCQKEFFLASHLFFGSMIQIYRIVNKFGKPLLGFLIYTF